VPEAETSNESRIQKLEEELTFLDDYVSKQDQEILNLQTKLHKTISELKELRERFDTSDLTAQSGNEKPPHY